MTTISEPTNWNRIIYRGTDHEWVLRRVDSTGQPIIPESAEAQIRARYGTPVWVSPTITIDPVDGWITLSIPEAATAGSAWDNYVNGVWDLEVVVSGLKMRWVEGKVTVSQDVTR